MIKKYKEFVSETILPPSGGNYIVFDEPVYGRPTSKPSLGQEDTDLIEGMDGNIYTYSDYNDLYVDYLKKQNPLLQNGFNKVNLDTVLTALSDN